MDTGANNKQTKEKDKKIKWNNSLFKEGKFKIKDWEEWVDKMSG